MAEPIDLLDRQEFVDKMFSVTELLSKRKKNVCYAVNGGWGVGKSFVLDMFERQVEKKAIKNCEVQYMVFRYNCWEYDYYEEPLIAIVAAMLDEIKEKEAKIPEEDREKIKGILKVIGRRFLKKAYDWIEKKTNVSVEEIVDMLKEGKEMGEEETKELHKFDAYFEFKKVLEDLRETIAGMAKKQTLIFIVDELDRCLPEYTIKVLERLHHLFDEIPNVQVVLSIDKEQLQHTVRNLYGNAVDAEKYFAKFIDFEMKLDVGGINDQFDAMFEEYIAMFTAPTTLVEAAEIDEFKTIIFKGVDMRERIAVMNKCLLLHDMIREKDKEYDCVYMCMTMFLTILDCFNIKICSGLPSKSLAEIQNDPKNKGKEGLMDLNEKFYEKGHEKYVYANDYGGRKHITVRDVWSKIFAAYRHLQNDKYVSSSNNGYPIENLLQYCEKFQELIQIIS